MISGRAFAERCRWVVDPRYPERPLFSHADSADGDWVFVNGDYLNEFLRRVPNQQKKYVVVIHNTDRSFGANELYALTPYIRHVYAMNTVVQDPLLTTIPIGFVDRQAPFLSGFTKGNEPRTIEIYMNFTVETNRTKRLECADAFKHDTRVVRADNRSVPEYYADLCRSTFVLCPEGTGIDTHRVYESILCGAIPVVVRNSLSHLYETLPVCILDTWTDPLYVPTPKEFPLNVQHYLGESV
jgi:hypothetical protein